MKEDQLHDLLEIIHRSEDASHPMAVEDVEVAMISFKMHNDGLIAAAGDVHLIDEYKSQYAAADDFRNFRTWVESNGNPEDQLRVRWLKPRSDRDDQAITPGAVRKQLEQMQELAVRLGIANEETKAIEKPECVFSTDEKGISPKGVSKARCVSTSSRGRRSTFATTEVGFKHISIVGFVSLAGVSYGPGVVVSGERVDPTWSKLWDDASFAATKKGSITVDLFLQFLHDAFVAQMPPHLQKAYKILILDSGGGALLHISVKICKFFVRWNIYPYYLKPYCTAALMSLDQRMHAMVQSGWTDALRRCAKDGQAMSTLKAIEVLREVCLDAFGSDLAIESYRRTGWVAHKCIQISNVLVERKDEIFQNSRQDLSLDCPESRFLQSAWQRVRSNQKKPCVKCGLSVKSGQAFCLHCGVRNENHSELSALIEKGATRKGGGGKSAYTGEDLSDHDSDEDIGGWIGDLRSRIHSKRRKVTGDHCADEVSE